MDHGAIATVFIMMASSLLCGGAPTEPPTGNQESTDRERAEAYLSQFYYNAQPPSFNSSNRQATMHSFEETLESMQRFFGLEVTGRPDASTLEAMSRPRCGVPDVADYQHFPGRPRWHQKTVTYRVTLYTNQLSRKEVDATIASAFKLYSDVIPLDFKQIYSGTADIMLLFKARHHGDFYPFDGPGGVLAHANAPGPGEGGDTHFDDDEKWVLGQRGVNLLLVAAHELGHALGLGHSQDRSALMFPTYHYVDTRGYALPADDRRGVQALYGVRTARPDPRPKPKPDPRPKPKPDPRPKPKPDPKPPSPRPEPRPPTRCDRDLVFDAATAIRNELYFFKNGHYWKKNGNGVTMKKIASTWRRINRVSAAYEHKGKDTVFFFHGRQYWGTRGTTVLRGFPKPLSTLGFPSYVSDIDAAVHVPSAGKTLFFTKNLYWSFDESSFKMDRGYPRSVYTDFPGIGYAVDAAFQNHGYLYFSNGARQTEYHYQSRRVKRVLLNYVWLDCY